MFIFAMRWKLDDDDERVKPQDIEHENDRHHYILRLKMLFMRTILNAVPFVKLDAQILDSTLWMDVVVRNVFITALLLAEPREIKIPLQQLDVETSEPLDFVVPAGWYGFVAKPGPGIVDRSKIDRDIGMAALKELGQPDPHSRTASFDGRRMVRVDGGYIVLNFMKFRDYDHQAAERMRNLRARRKAESVTVTPVTLHAVTANVPDVQANVTYSRRQKTEDRVQKDQEQKNMTRSLKFALPSLGEIQSYCKERGSKVDPQQFFDYYTSNGWKVGRNLMRDWRATVRNWERRENKTSTMKLSKQEESYANIERAVREVAEENQGQLPLAADGGRNVAGVRKGIGRFN